MHLGLTCAKGVEIIACANPLKPAPNECGYRLPNIKYK